MPEFSSSQLSQAAGDEASEVAPVEGVVVAWEHGCEEVGQKLPHRSCPSGLSKPTAREDTVEEDARTYGHHPKTHIMPCPNAD